MSDNLAKLFTKSEGKGPNWRPTSIPRAQWVEMKRIRSEPISVQRRETNRRNRAQLQAISTTGSIPMSVLADRMEAATGEPTEPDVLFEASHRVVDIQSSQKVSTVMAKFKKERALLGPHATKREIYLLWVRCVGGIQQSHVFGLGDIGQQFFVGDPGASSSSSHAPSSTNQEPTPSDLHLAVEMLQAAMHEQTDRQTHVQTRLSQQEEVMTVIRQDLHHLSELVRSIVPTAASPNRMDPSMLARFDQVQSEIARLATVISGSVHSGESSPQMPTHPPE